MRNRLNRFGAILFHERLHPWLVVTAAIAVRPRALAAPDSAVLSWRSADLASVAWSYAEHGMRFFYPEVFWGGAGPNYVEMEFPIVPYAVAVLYRLFGVHEGLAIIIPTLAGVLAPLALYFLVRRRLGTVPAVIAALLLALAPSFAFQTQRLFSDGVMVTSSILAVLAFERWAASGDWRLLAASAAAIAMTGLLKPYALIVGAPIVAIGVQRFGWRGFLSRPSIWASGIASLAAVAGWYWWAYQLGVATGNSFGVLAGGYSKLARADLLLSFPFWQRLAWRLTAYHLNPVGIVGGAVGFLSRATPNAMPFRVWVIAAFGGALVTAEGTHQMLYYQLPMLPPACALAGLGLARIGDRLTQKTARLPRLARQAAVTAAGGVVMAALSFSFWAYLVRSDFLSSLLERRAQAERLGRLLEHDAPMIQVTMDYSGGGPGSFFPAVPLPRGKHQTPPEFFYFSRHRGWYLAAPWVTLDEIERLRGHGARYLVVSDYFADDVRQFRTTRPDLVDELSRRYQVVAEDRALLVYDLGALRRP